MKIRAFVEPVRFVSGNTIEESISYLRTMILCTPHMVTGQEDGRRKNTNRVTARTQFVTTESTAGWLMFNWMTTTGDGTTAA